MKSDVSYKERGSYGNSRYRGNCSGRLIEDIIEQYRLDSLSDYMVGGGTTEDVCRAKGISGTFLDLNRGYDMMTMDIPDRIQNCFWHPPYADIVVYSDKMYSAQAVIDKYGFDPRTNDLSRCKTWEEFVRAMNYCCLKQYSSLEKGGRMFILMGDIKKRADCIPCFPKSLSQELWSRLLSRCSITAYLTGHFIITQIMSQSFMNTLWFFAKKQR